MAIRHIIILSQLLFQGFFAKRGYVVHLYHRSYHPIRQSDRILPISDFNPYTEGLWHSRIDPAYLPDLPQFTLRFLLYMPSSLLRQAVSLHSSVSSRNVSVFAHNVKAQHLLHCPRHFRLISQRTGDFPKLQCSLYATACKFARPTEVASYTFVRIWVLLLPSFPVIGHPHTSRI